MRRFGDDVTPRFFMEIAEPLEETVQRLEDQMILNIARIFRGSPEDWKRPSMQWQARKLAQIGALNAKNMQAIARARGDESTLTVLAIEKAISKALKAIDPPLMDAWKAGLLQGGGPSGMDEAIARELDTYAQQAIDRVNMVNTVMLNSSLDQVRQVVSDTTAYEAKLAQAQEILNARTGEVVTGITSRQQAVSRAVKDMAKKGLTGFIDASGRSWSPEAYVSMDIRTTAHNAAIQATFNRADEYGCSLVEVSAHAGARPRCEPFQGRIFDRNNGSGYTTDGAGKRIHYTPWASTSYGEAAGLLGINCGHFIYPFIPHYSTKTFSPYPKAENDRVYQESQQQRGIERKIRNAKRVQAVLQTVGDKEGAAKAAKDILAAQAEMRAFLKETGRTRRRDREQVYSYAAKPQPPKPQTHMHAPPPPPKTTKKIMQKPAEPLSLEDLTREAEKLGVKYARFEKMNLEHVRNIVDAVKTLPADAVPKFISDGKDVSTVTGRKLGRKADQWWGVTYDYRLYGFRTMQLGYEKTDNDGGLIVGINSQKFKTIESITKAKEESNRRYFEKTGRYWSFNTRGEATAFHEIGHCFADVRGLPSGWDQVSKRWADESKCDMLKTPDEAFAEAWAAYHLKDERLPGYIVDIMKGLK